MFVRQLIIHTEEGIVKWDIYMTTIDIDTGTGIRGMGL